MPRSRFRTDLLFILFIWIVWAFCMGVWNQWGLFVENWFMSVTMAFGSFIAGSTSQGGGAVAFPVMTLGFNIDPHSARDFSLMIQSVGMTSAAITIFARRIAVEKFTLVFAGMGGVIGVGIGLHWIQPFFAANPTKIFFVSLWLAFGLALIFINRIKRPLRFETLPEKSPKIAVLLFLTGIPGGMVSGLLGSGLDMLVFAVLLLGFRVCEKVATPTSVILMAIVSVAGFAWRLLFPGEMEILPKTWEYWWVCVPVVAIGAPLGARFISGRGRRFVVGLLLFLILAQFIAALVIIPFDQSLILLAVCTFLIGTALFRLIWFAGKRYARSG